MKLRTLLLTCACMLALAGVVNAQMTDTTKPAPVTTTDLATATSEISVSGTVVSSTSTELVIDSNAGQRMSFALDRNAIPAANFTVGEHVTVQYHSLSGGTVYQAAHVVIEPRVKVEPMARVEPMAKVEPTTTVEPRTEVEPMAKVEPRNYDVTAPDGAQLPRTASNLPLIGLLGLLALSGAVVTRVALS